MSSLARAGAAQATPGEDDYVVLCNGVRKLTGIDLSQYKRVQMERRIRTFAERRGIGGGLTGLIVALRREEELLTAFLDHVTINVSQLWRNPEQWDVLAKHVLPELGEHGRVRAWSAGCSYGAEAYTVAAICKETLPSARIELRGTDIDPRMVERAREGVFSAADARDAPTDKLARWFHETDGGWQAKDELRRITTFEVGDLLRLRPRSEWFDLVLCRNTVIYFNDEIRNALHVRLAESLRAGGYLIIGSTERVAEPKALGLISTHPFTYRKV